MRRLFAPEIDFRAMTPRRTWEAQDPEAVLAIVFGHWFDQDDRIESLEHVETDGFADRERVGYRLSVSNSEGRFLVEQQAYLSAGEGQGDGDGDGEGGGEGDGDKIAWMRMLCSGYRPVAE